MHSRPLPFLLLLIAALALGALVLLLELTKVVEEAPLRNTEHVEIPARPADDRPPAGRESAPTDIEASTAAVDPTEEARIATPEPPVAELGPDSRASLVLARK